MNEEIWKAFESGFGGGFLSDGLTLDIPTEMDDPESWATMKLMAGYGYNRWADSLSTLDLKDLMYVYGEFDEAVGRLREDEIATLESTGASILAIAGGSHSSMFEVQYMFELLDFIRRTQGSARRKSYCQTQT